jgi:hypothetical protein
MVDHADNICAGTQVVSLMEGRGTNNSLVHPLGAVGVVTRTPAVHGEKFPERFPDEIEFSPHRNRLVAVKRGELPWPALSRPSNGRGCRRQVGVTGFPWRKELHRDSERALAKTRLLERPDYEAVNRFLIKARRLVAASRGMQRSCASREDRD